MGLNIDKEVAQMRRMTVRELQTKFAEVCGEPPRSHNRQWMIKRLAWKMQAREYGGLSEAALRRAKEIADMCDLSDLRVTAPRDFSPATPDGDVPAFIHRARRPPTDSRNNDHSRLQRAEALRSGTHRRLFV